MKKHFELQRRCKIKKDENYYRERIKNLSLRIHYLREKTNKPKTLFGKKEYTYFKTIRQLEKALKKNKENLKRCKNGY